jgi:REP element-mobilizing transposase RayT
MRYRRIKPNSDTMPAFYHLMTKTVNGEFLFHDREKDRLRKHLWLVAERCGIEVLTYELMTNHFHIVVYVPKKEALSDQELLRRYALLHPGCAAWETERLDRIERMLAENGAEAEAWRAAELRRMNDISEFMKLLKQRYSTWFNRNHDRFGTLWYDRFKSVLLEAGRAVRRCMAYVNTNAVRARICQDPTTYPFSAYAEALAGSARARLGIAKALGASDWSKAICLYRRMLLARSAKLPPPEATTQADDRGFVQGRQPAECLRRRCRCFSDGAVLGSKAFVNGQVAEYRIKTNLGQRTEPQTYPELGTSLVVMRKLNMRPASG